MFLTNTIHVTAECLIFYNWAGMSFTEARHSCRVYSDDSSLSSSWSKNIYKIEIWGN